MPSNRMMAFTSGSIHDRIHRFLWDIVFGVDNFPLLTPWFPGDKKILSF